MLCLRKTFSLHDRSRSSVVLAFCQFQCNEVIQLPGEKSGKTLLECEFISKFAIESASYKRTNDSIFVIQVTSPDIDKLIEMQKEFGSLSELRMLDDKYFYANIGLEEDSLIKKCSAPYELLWAFMEEKYSLLLKESSEGEETLMM